MDRLIKRLDQSEGQSCLPRPVVVYVCSLDFSSSAPLSGGAGLGSLGSPAVRYLDSEGLVFKFLKKLFFQGNSCYYCLNERIRLQEQNFGRFFPGKTSQKPFLDCGCQGCCINSVFLSACSPATPLSLTGA